MKKRLLAVLLAASMTAGLLAGCGGGGQGAKNDAQESEGTTEDGDYPVIKMAYTVMFPSTSEESIDRPVFCSMPCGGCTQ